MQNRLETSYFPQKIIFKNSGPAVPVSVSFPSHTKFEHRCFGWTTIIFTDLSVKCNSQLVILPQTEPTERNVSGNSVPSDNVTLRGIFTAVFSDTQSVSSELSSSGILIIWEPVHGCMRSTEAETGNCRSRSEFENSTNYLILGLKPNAELTPICITGHTMGDVK